jgi:hypothetical protein
LRLALPPCIRAASDLQATIGPARPQK